MRVIRESEVSLDEKEGIPCPKFKHTCKKESRPMGAAFSDTTFIRNRFQIISVITD